MTNAPSVWPGLLCTDAPATIRFLVEAFGFVETIVVPGEQDGEIRGPLARGRHRHDR